MSAPKKANKPQASAARNSGTVPEIKVTERKGLIEVNIKFLVQVVATTTVWLMLLSVWHPTTFLLPFLQDIFSLPFPRVPAYIMTVTPSRGKAVRLGLLEYIVGFLFLRCILPNQPL